MPENHPKQTTGNDLTKPPQPPPHPKAKRKCCGPVSTEVLGR